MRVLISGGRTLDLAKVLQWLDTNLAIRCAGLPSFIIEGGATGADQGARMYRNAHQIAGQTFNAAWENLTLKPCVIKWRADGSAYNVLAGFARNQQMIDEGKPEVAVVFKGGKGTADMVKRLKKAGIEIIDARDDPANLAANNCTLHWTLPGEKL
jgi:hypothetical protein